LQTVLEAVHGRKALRSVLEPSHHANIVRICIGLRGTTRKLSSRGADRTEAMDKGGDMGGSAANNSSDFVSFLWWLAPDPSRLTLL
jgi:hypothetical protein